MLLVDDNFDHRFLVRRALKPLEGRLRVVVAEDGEDAWAQLRKGLVPGLVLLDVKMPRRDGFELLADIRADEATRAMRVAMFSSSENRADLERALALGADEYVTKALDAKQFQADVRAVVERWLARAEER